IAKSGFRTTVQGLRDQLIGGAKAILFLLWGGALVVLIIGCVNVMNLVAMRATARSRELTTRVVLGASLTAIARQILTESLVLAGLGAFVGLVLSWGALHSLTVLGIERIPRGAEIALDGATVLYTLALTTVVGAAVALMPIIQLRNPDLSRPMREDGRSVTATREFRVIRQCLVTMQVAFALVLLAGAGLLVTSLIQVLRVDLGFRPQNVLTGSVSLPSTRYLQQPAITSTLDQILARVRALPGVQAAGFA